MDINHNVITNDSIISTTPSYEKFINNEKINVNLEIVKTLSDTIKIR